VELVAHRAAPFSLAGPTALPFAGSATLPFASSATFALGGSAMRTRVPSRSCGPGARTMVSLPLRPCSISISAP